MHEKGIRLRADVDPEAVSTLGKGFSPRQMGGGGEATTGRSQQEQTSGGEGLSASELAKQAAAEERARVLEERKRQRELQT